MSLYNSICSHATLRPQAFLSFCLSKTQTKMQNTVLALSHSPSASLPKPLYPNPKISFLLHSPSSIVQLRRVSWQTALDTSSSSSSLIFKAQISASLRKNKNLTARAALVPESAEEGASQSGLTRTLQLGSMFGIWYLLNIYFNIFNKQVVITFPIFFYIFVFTLVFSPSCFGYKYWV